METTARPLKALRFGPFELYRDHEKLLKNGVAVKLQDQPLKLLVLLLERHGEIVSREEMRVRLWPADSFGDFDNGLNVAVKKLRTALEDDSDRPQYVETVPRRGYRFIAEVVEIDSAVAEQAASIPSPSVLETISPAPPNLAESGPVSDRPPVFTRRRILFFSAITVFLIATAIAALFTRPRFAPTFPRVLGNHGPVRRSVAVLGFRNSSGRTEDTWLSTALSEMLSTELAAGDQLRMISGEDVVHVRLAQASMDVDSVSRTTARQLRNALNTDLIVSGSYVAVGDKETRLVRLDVRLQDAASGEILTEVSDTGTEVALFQMVGNVGKRLRQKLGLSDISVEQHAQVLASMPSSREAGEFYSKGLLKLRIYDALSAQELLQQSIAVEPSFPLAHSAMSEAWGRLGYDRRALDEAQKASQLSSSLLPTDRLRVQARYWEATRDWDKAGEAYRSLHSSFPDDPEYGILLANCLVRAGKGQEAIAMLEALRGLPSSGPAEARIDLAVAEASLAVGNLDRASSASQAAAAAARTQGQSLLLARALRTQALVYENLGQYDQAIAATEQARPIYEAAGDRFGVASVLEVQGNILSDRGDLSAALDKYQMELTIVREIGNRRGEASALNNIALVLYQQGDLERSRGMWEQAENAFRELVDKSNTAVVMVNIGGVLKDQGDLASAGHRYQDALALSREVHDAGGTVLALRALGTALDAMGDYTAARESLHQAMDIDLANGVISPSSESLLDLGDVMRHEGDLAGARKTYQDALAASQKNGEKSWNAYALYGLGRLAFLSADFAGADAEYQQALQIRKELGETLTVAETEMAVAEVAIAQGLPGEAVPVLHRVREIFRKSGKQDQVIAATTLLCRALMAEGKSDEALHEFATLPMSGKIQNVEMRMAVGIGWGRLQMAAGKRADAQATFQSVLQQAQRVGSLEYLFEARLGLLETEPATAAREAELARLSSDAAHAGFQLVVQSIRAEQ